MDITYPHDSFFRFVVSKVGRAIDLFRYQIPPAVTQHLIFDSMASETDTIKK